MSYKTYEEYKNSHVDWIMDIPQHWSICPLKHVVNIIMGQSPNSNDINDEKQGILFMQGNAEFTDLYPNPTMYCTSPKKISRQGDILMSVRAPVGELNISDKQYGIGRGLCSIKAIKVYSPFLWYYLLKSKTDFNYFSNGSTFDAITINNLSSFPISIPKLDEQKQIANYLDNKIVIIDETIEKNKKIIDLLEEKRNALINQVVTKGLNPDVPIKDSGISWIGEIPEHWKTNKIKNMAYVKGRIGWHGLTSEEYSDEGAYLVTGTDFAEGTVDWNHCNHISYERYKQDPNIHLKENDLLITKDGTIGKLALIKDIPDKATLNSGIFLVRPLKDNYTNDYLYWILSSDIFTRFFDYIKTGATIAHLYQETFERFFFPYMSINEQNEIVTYLKNNVSQINFIIKKVEENINLLEEYKSSLIHHVVTGKIDVRGEEI